MIEAINLTKVYDNTPAITDVSFTVEKGEILGFLGPNGAGKTTTMRILTGFLPPTSGTAKVAGFDVLNQSKEVRQRIGYMPENPPVYGDMTVSSFLRFISKIKGVPAAKEKECINLAIQKCALESVHKRLIGHLSRGYRQRVGLAQALIHDPEVLILDEPTIGLDPAQIIEIRQLIKGLAGEHTVILSSHILPEVEQTCARVVIINKGKIIAVDSPEKLSMSLRGANLYTVRVKRPSAELEEQLRKLSGVVDVKADSGSYTIETEKDHDVREELAELVVGKKAGLLELAPVAFTLEDVFVQLTTAEQTPAAS
ncbi:MAG TPA: ABC transporter ATP-binding protein [Acidobacteriota bacterium]|nr:ABC transporter ATP-binding protein [Acidobacteriota bacterium]